MKQLFVFVNFVLPFIAFGQNSENLDSIKERELEDSICWKEFQEKLDRITVCEICNVPFGCPYEKAETILEKKYGISNSLSDRTQIVYENQTYAGIHFDEIIFLFQSDGVNSYMNGCVFVLKAKTLQEAREQQEKLKTKLSYKYELSEYKDKNNEKYYLGGIPPKNCQDSWLISAFSIDIIKYDVADIYKNYVNGYAARLFYGRYNYIKEEF